MEKKYCAFIDVLGYKSIVSDLTRTEEEKVKILMSIYENIAFHLRDTIIEINQVINNEIFIKSFSDCFYLESSNLLGLLYSIKQVFKKTFGLYSNITDGSEYTPLIRGGIVKDWTVRFKDLASFVNNQEGTNPVGLGVARAYWTSEKSNLSGMRVIISPEVTKDLNLVHYSRNNYDCLVQEYVYKNVPLYLFFDQIKENEKGCEVDLLEMIWPEEAMSDCIYDFISQLEIIKSNFNRKSMRHYKKTAEVILKGLLLSDCNERSSEAFMRSQTELKTIIEQAQQNINT